MEFFIWSLSTFVGFFVVWWVRKRIQKRKNAQGIEQFNSKKQMFLTLFLEKILLFFAMVGIFVSIAGGFWLFFELYCKIGACADETVNVFLISISGLVIVLCFLFVLLYIVYL